MRIYTDTRNMTYCSYCNAYHVGMCHRIKSMEYYPDGTIKKVELNS